MDAQTDGDKRERQSALLKKLGIYFGGIFLRKFVFLRVI